MVSEAKPQIEQVPIYLVGRTEAVIEYNITLSEWIDAGISAFIHE